MYNKTVVENHELIQESLLFSAYRYARRQEKKLTALTVATPGLVRHPPKTMDLFPQCPTSTETSRKRKAEELEQKTADRVGKLRFHTLDVFIKEIKQGVTTKLNLCCQSIADISSDEEDEEEEDEDDEDDNDDDDSDDDR
ncbi:hypothetical protein ACLB2K_048804 [Fragaria x ananassa]